MAHGPSVRLFYLCQNGTLLKTTRVIRFVDARAQIDAHDPEESAVKQAAFFRRKHPLDSRRRAAIELMPLIDPGLSVSRRF
jgi:hypothetical protein